MSRGDSREMGQLHAANKSTRLFRSVYDCCETEAERDLQETKRYDIKRESDEKKKRETERQRSWNEKRDKRVIGRARVVFIVRLGKFCWTIERVDLALVNVYITLAPTTFWDLS